MPYYVWCSNAGKNPASPEFRSEKIVQNITKANEEALGDRKKKKSTGKTHHNIISWNTKENSFQIRKIKNKI